MKSVKNEDNYESICIKFDYSINNLLIYILKEKEIMKIDYLNNNEKIIIILYYDLEIDNNGNRIEIEIEEFEDDDSYFFTYDENVIKIIKNYYKNADVAKKIPIKYLKDLISHDYYNELVNTYDLFHYIEYDIINNDIYIKNNVTISSDVVDCVDDISFIEEIQKNTYPLKEDKCYFFFSDDYNKNYLYNGKIMKSGMYIDRLLKNVGMFEELSSIISFENTYLQLFANIDCYTSNNRTLFTINEILPESSFKFIENNKLVSLLGGVEPELGYINKEIPFIYFVNHINPVLQIIKPFFISHNISVGDSFSFDNISLIYPYIYSVFHGLYLLSENSNNAEFEFRINETVLIGDGYEIDCSEKAKFELPVSIPINSDSFVIRRGITGLNGIYAIICKNDEKIIKAKFDSVDYYEKLPNIIKNGSYEIVMDFKIEIENKTDHSEIDILDYYLRNISKSVIRAKDEESSFILSNITKTNIGIGEDILLENITLDWEDLYKELSNDLDENFHKIAINYTQVSIGSLGRITLINKQLFLKTYTYSSLLSKEFTYGYIIPEDTKDEYDNIHNSGEDTSIEYYICILILTIIILLII